MADFFRALLSGDVGKDQGQLRVLGIDLGTTKSTAAEVIYDPHSGSSPRARCVCIDQPFDGNDYRSIIVPSVVALYNGGTVVGEGAQRLRSRAGELGLVQNETFFAETKNLMGVRRTNPRAPEGFRNAADIAGKVLQFITTQCAEAKPARTVVTVPASFQCAQRRDTMKAAEQAQIPIAGGDLLDEPVAALEAYLIEAGATLDFSEPRTVLVLDFGGGTCDVAVLRCTHDAETQRMALSPLSISRYHRLGGGDIDAAIVYEVLLPQLLAQNKLDADDLDFDDKKNAVEPVLKPLAETLKVMLCTEQAGSLTLHAKREVRLSKKVVIKLGKKKLKLDNPSLTVEQFETVMAAFLDPDLLYTNDGQYRLTCSIFAPIEDALDRCAIPRGDVDFVLLAGGSTLIPQVKSAVAARFPNAVMLAFPDPQSTQTAVARGAAYHALALTLTGKGIVDQVAQDEVAILSDAGPVPIVPQGAHLPFPDDEAYKVFTGLAVPQDGLTEAIDIRVTLVAGSDHRPVYTGVWHLEGLVNKGDPVRLEYRFDENQILWLRLFVEDGIARTPFEARIEHPLTHVVNPNRARLEALEVEEEIRSGAMNEKERSGKYERLAELSSELGEYDKAIDCLKKAMKLRSGPDAGLLNTMGTYYGLAGNKEAEERMYLLAADANATWGTPHFNMALKKRDRGDIAGAIEAVNEALRRQQSGPYLALKGMLLEGSGKHTEAETFVKQAAESFRPVRLQSEWELWWCNSVAEKLQREQDLERIRQERERRKGAKPEALAPQVGLLPMLRTVGKEAGAARMPNRLQ